MKVYASNHHETFAITGRRACELVTEALQVEMGARSPLNFEMAFQGMTERNPSIIDVEQSPNRLWIHKGREADMVMSGLARLRDGEDGLRNKIRGLRAAYVTGKIVSRTKYLGVPVTTLDMFEYPSHLL